MTKDTHTHFQASVWVHSNRQQKHWPTKQKRKTSPHEEQMSLEYPTAWVTTTRLAPVKLAEKFRLSSPRQQPVVATVRSTSWSNTRLLPRVPLKERLPNLVQLATSFLYVAADDDAGGRGHSVY
jgi:hypothetical protein